MDKKNPHGSSKVDFSKLAFYRSLKVVQDNTGLNTRDILFKNSGFKASPATCLCGHEWSVFDEIIESVNQGHHNWDFFKKPRSSDEIVFFHKVIDLTCQCGITTKGVSTLYIYEGGGGPYGVH